MRGSQARSMLLPMERGTEGERGAEGTSRLIELEHKLAFMERSFEELNEVVIEQGRALEEARRELRRLRECLPEADASQPPGVERSDPLSERPPHY